MKTDSLFPVFLARVSQNPRSGPQALAECFAPVSQKVWGAYRAPGKAAFAQRLRRLREWAERTLPDSPMKRHTLDLCAQRAQFGRSHDHSRAHRTSNLVDRLMKFFDRACFKEPQAIN